jgi:hypothetical protein
MVSRRRRVLAIVAWAYLVGILVQVFLAGAGLFELSDWMPHTELGWGLWFGALVLPILAAVLRADRWTVGLAIVLFAAVTVQVMLAMARTTYPILAAIHPLNAFLIVWLAWALARRTSRPPGAPLPAATAASAPAVDPAAD